MAVASGSVNCLTARPLAPLFQAPNAVGMVLMFRFYRTIAMGFVLSAAEVCAADARLDLKDITIRAPGEMYALGVMLDEGLGVTPDEHGAFEWYSAGPVDHRGSVPVPCSAKATSVQSAPCSGAR